MKRMGALVCAASLGGCYFQQSQPATPATATPPPAESAPPPGVDPAWWQSDACLVVTVKNLEVAARDYDGAAPEARSGLFCTLLGVGAGVVAGVVTGGAAAPAGYSGMKSVCESIGDGGGRGGQQHRRPEAPDVAIGIKVGDRVVHRSPTLWDSYAGDFGHAMLVPVAAVPEEGIKLVVLDDDPPGYQEIGSFRLSRDRLARMRNAGLQRLSDFGPNVGSLEIDVTDFVAPAAASGRLDVASVRAVASVAVPAGAVVIVRARGSYSVREGETITPIGSGAPGTNLAPLANARHGAAYVAVGDGNESKFVPIPDCRVLVSAPPGYLVYGVNDAGRRDDNRGRLDLTIETQQPTPREWSSGFRVEGCR